MAISRTGTALRLYVNGVQVAASTSAASIPAQGFHPNFLRIGCVLTDGASPAGSNFNGYVDEVRVTKGIGRYPSAFVPIRQTFPESKIDGNATFDPYAIDVTSQFAFDGADQSQVILDAKANNVTVTGNAAAARLSTTRPKNGSASLFLNSGYLLVEQNATRFTGAEWTIEAWVWVDSTKTNNTLFHSFPYFTLGISLNRGGNGETHVYIGNGSAWITPPTINSHTNNVNLPLNAWGHIALVKFNGVISLYHNGRLAGATTSIPQGFTGNFRIGALTDGTELYKGYIDNFRITTKARYHSNFVPSPNGLPLLTNSEYTSRLGVDDVQAASVGFQLAFDSRNIVDTTGRHALTVTGVIPSTAVAVENGSGLFASTNVISTPGHADFAFGTNNFTIEAWVMATSTPASRDIASTARNNDGDISWIFGTDANNRIRFLTWITVIATSTTALANNAWYHVAVTRSAGTVRLFINGVLEATAASTQNFTNVANALWISNATGASSWPGYIDNLRITKGVARYTSSFTPEVK